MKVLLVTPYFPPALGGVQNYVFNIALGLKQTYEIDVVVVTSNPGGKKQKIEDCFGVKVYRLPIMMRISNTPINPLWYLTLKRIIRLEKPDIINAHQPVPFIGDLAAFLSGNIPFILTYHSGIMRKNRLLPDIIIYLYEKIVLPQVAKKATRIICASKFIRNSILQKHIYKSTIIHPGVDISHFKPNPSIEKEKNLILFICASKIMHRMKGLYYLLAAIDEIPGARLRIIGEKRDFTDERVISVGPKHGNDLVEEIQKASVLVLASLAHMESFGMVLIEAMACQTPVVGTNIGGIPEVISDGIDGFIVPPENSTALALAISKILADKALATRIGQSGIKKIREQFTWETRTALTKELFEACLK